MRTAVLYGLETETLTKRQETGMELAELKILVRSDKNGYGQKRVLSAGQRWWDCLERKHERQD